MSDPIGAVVVPFELLMRVPIGRILVIDDNPAVVHFLVTCLREQGYGVLGALTSDDGLRLITSSRPDLVLLDITLPGINGIEVLKRIRSIDPTIGVIMVTASTDPLLAREASNSAHSPMSTNHSISPASCGLSPWRSGQLPRDQTINQ